MDVVKLMFGQDFFGFNTEIVNGGGGVGGVIYVGREVLRRKFAFRLNQASLKSTSGQHFNVKNVRSRPPQCLRTSYYEVNLYGPI
jgi:hypothetical protein